MPALRTLRVFANPYHHLDHEGRPSAVVPFEPEGNGVTTFDDRRFVGATLSATITRTPAHGEAALHPEQRTTFEFSDEPTTVRDSAYYRMAVARGELVAADAETAAQCGVDHDPTGTLERAKAKALADLARLDHEEHGPDFADALKAHAFGPMKGTKASKATPDLPAPAPATALPKGAANQPTAFSGGE